MRALLHALERQPWCSAWRQNVGAIVVRDQKGRAKRRFSSGVRKGAADISGYVKPEGWRLEVECKAARGVMRPSQSSFERELVAGGGVYALVQYDERLSPSENVRRGIALVHRAILARRARP